ncbi:hypothetical protein niasHT_030186 [Heterodera trifolii]|uniref:Uncharacterized protein n=1 Tax=Heterodera trifolii TaxID=157864 RepID=A0ABD2K2R9_9BILA
MISIANCILLLIPLLFPLRFTAASGLSEYGTLKNVSFDTQEEAEMAKNRTFHIPFDYFPRDIFPPLKNISPDDDGESAKGRGEDKHINCWHDQKIDSAIFCGLDSSEYKWEEDGISSPMAKKRIATIPVDYRRPPEFLPPENLRRTPKTAEDEPIGSSAATNEMENPMRFTNILLVLLAPMAALTFFCFLVVFLCIHLNGCRRYWHGTSKVTAVSTALLSSSKACNNKIAAVLLDAVVVGESQSPPPKTLALIDTNIPTNGARLASSNGCLISRSFPSPAPSSAPSSAVSPRPSVRLSPNSPNHFRLSVLFVARRQFFPTDGRTNCKLSPPTDRRTDGRRELAELAKSPKVC